MCKENDDVYTYIEAHGSLIMSHNIEKEIDVNKFISFYRGTYRICWREFY